MRPLHVLLVDDDPTDLELAQDAFEAHAGAVVLSTCTSGQGALAFLNDPARPRPDVTVLDINMPLMSGFEVLRRMKEDELLMDIPVVMLSTSTSRQDVKLAYTLHASSYMVKKAEFPDFVRQIDAFVTFLQQSRLTTWPEF